MTGEGVAITIEGLTHGYGGPAVLRGLDLTVPSGHTTAVLGPSGCGKTTLLRAIAGFIRPQAGTIVLGETIVTSPTRSVPARARHVGYVAQEGALFPHRDVAGNIAFGLSLSGLRPRARTHAARVDELLTLVGLDLSLRHRMPHELSGGQQQRVALARALAPEPSVILLDEPFSSLDTQSRSETGAATTAALRARGVTAVLITHDPREAMSLADTIAVLDGGVVAQYGAPEEVYGRPASATVARTLGPANLLAADVRDGHADTALGRLELGPRGHAGPDRGLADLGVGGSTRHTLVVVVRPEQVLVSSSESPGSVVAQVVSSTYHGHDHLLRLRLAGGTVVDSRSSSAVRPQVGDHVHTSVDGSVPLVTTDGPAG